MRRLLKLQTWTLRGTTAADASFVLLAATVVVPVLLFIGASWLAYGDTQRQYEERLERAPWTFSMSAPAPRSRRSSSS